MEQRLSVVTLGVADLERSRRFYEQGLGWAKGTDDEGIAFYQLNGLVFALFPRRELASDAGLPPDGSGFGGVTLAYCTRSREEVDDTLRRAQRAGAHILKAAGDTSWGGYSGYFADPDGYPWEVAWQPAWRITPAGETVLQR